jgi:nucleoside-diphosphate-sugar epimerase
VTKALIGYTGFVGGSLLRQTQFDDLYNSANSQAMRGRTYDLMICAGAPAAKWIVNREPEKDRSNLEGLMENLRQVTAGRFLLISTVDVYRMPPPVYEDSPIDPGLLDAYGRHRFYLEEFVRRQFERAFIVRLPGLFGEGLKKNFIYDLLHSNALDWTHKDSLFQFYDMERLWQDLEKVLDANLPLVNFATEPVRAADVARISFDMTFDNFPDKPPACYDMRTRFAHHFGSPGDYLYSAEETFERIRRYVGQEKAGRLA